MTLRKTLHTCLGTNVPFFVVLTRDKQKWNELQNTIKESVVHLEKKKQQLSFLHLSFCVAQRCCESAGTKPLLHDHTILRR